MRIVLTLACLLFSAWASLAQTSPSGTSVVVDDVFVLSKADQDDLRNISKAFSEKAKAIIANKELNPKERSEKLRSLRQERESSLSELLGAENYKLYKSQINLSKASRDSVARANKAKADGYKQKLKLTGQQTKDLEALIADYKAKKRELILKSEGTVEERKAKLAGLREEHLAKVKALLPADKFETFKSLKN
jgi:hypothetical protein